MFKVTNSSYHSFRNLDNLKIGFVGDLKYGRTIYSLVKLLNLYPNNKFYLISHKLSQISSKRRKAIEKINGEMVFTSKFVDKYFKLDPNKPSKTITAHLKVDNNAFVHYGDIPRGITPREAARIQSFPDDFFFEGGRSAAFRQIGNAVPPLMAEKIANAIMSKI